MTLEKSNAFIRALTQKTTEGKIEWHKLSKYVNEVKNNKILNEYIDFSKSISHIIYLDESFYFTHNDGMVLVLSGLMPFQDGNEVEYGDFLIQATSFSKLESLKDFYGEYVDTLSLAIKNYLCKDLSTDKAIENFMADCLAE